MSAHSPILSECSLNVKEGIASGGGLARTAFFDEPVEVLQIERLGEEEALSELAVKLDETFELVRPLDPLSDRFQLQDPGEFDHGRGQGGGLPALVHTVDE